MVYIDGTSPYCPPEGYNDQPPASEPDIMTFIDRPQTARATRPSPCGEAEQPVAENAEIADFEAMMRF
jgi:hypothetical protein